MVTIAGEHSQHGPGALGRFSASLVSYLHQLFAITGSTSLPWSHRATPPTLVLSGDDDPAALILNARPPARPDRLIRPRIVAGGPHRRLLHDPVHSSSKLVEGASSPALLLPPARLPAFPPIRLPAHPVATSHLIGATTPGGRLTCSIHHSLRARLPSNSSLSHRWNLQLHGAPKANRWDSPGRSPEAPRA